MSYASCIINRADSIKIGKEMWAKPTYFSISATVLQNPRDEGRRVTHLVCEIICKSETENEIRALQCDQKLLRETVKKTFRNTSATDPISIFDQGSFKGFYLQCVFAALSHSWLLEHNVNQNPLAAQSFVQCWVIQVHESSHYYKHSVDRGVNKTFIVQCREIIMKFCEYVMK